MSFSRPPITSQPSLAQAIDKTHIDKTSTACNSVQLGWILIKNSLISPSQLAAALTAQFCCQKKLGDVLMEGHLISEDQLKDALREQIIRRRGHWVI